MFQKLAPWIRERGAWTRVVIFLLLLALIWLPIALPLYLWGYAANQSNVAEILALVLLYGLFLYGLPIWGRRVHRWQQPFAYCGLRFNRSFWISLCTALIIGVLGVFALFGTSTLLGWAVPTAPSPRIIRFAIEGLVMALAVGFAEEMLFRGWLLAELERDYASRVVLIMNALFFAAMHFIKPLDAIIETFPQFLGLFVLGLALVWARRSRTRFSRMASLGYPIGLHAGLIWGYYLVNVGGLSATTGQVPTWVTGINENPLAGLLGLVLLCAIAFQFAKVAQPKTHRDADTFL